MGFNTFLRCLCGNSIDFIIHDLRSVSSGIFWHSRVINVVQASDGVATFMSGGLASFAFWFMAIPADNIKKLVSLRLLF